MSAYNINDTMHVSNTHQVKVIKPLTVGYIQPPDSEYIVETADNRIEVYEVETISDRNPINVGNREVMISDNASCWLWGSVDEADVAHEHCDLLERASIHPLDLIEEIDDADLREYVREVVTMATTATAEEVEPEVEEVEQ